MSDVVHIARCPEHGLHGCRTHCYECGEEVEQVALVPLERAEKAEAVLEVCRRIVSAQAEDDALWDPQSVVEAYAVQELRTLHRAVEGDLTAVAAIEDP